MKDSPREDQFLNPPGLSIALAEAIAEKDENMPSLEEATLPHRPSPEIPAHEATIIAPERSGLVAATNEQIAMLKNQLEHARAQVQKLARPITIAEAMPVMDLYRQLIRIACPIRESEKDKWETCREWCVELQERFCERGRKCKLVRERCENLGEKCETLRQRCIKFCEFYDKYQEQVNTLFEEGKGEDDDEELYDSILGSIGQTEQKLEVALNECSEMLDKIEDAFFCAASLEAEAEYNIHQLRLFEGILDDILRSFDYWFGEL